MNGGARNPFNVDDVPDPFGSDVIEFAAIAAIDGADDDDNARPWGSSNSGGKGIEGSWSSRWNGAGLDWQRGSGELRIVEDRSPSSRGRAWPTGAIQAYGTMEQWAASGHVGAPAVAAVRDPAPRRLPRRPLQRRNW